MISKMRTENKPAAIQMIKRIHTASSKFEQLPRLGRRDFFYQILTVHHDLDHANNKQTSCNPNEDNPHKLKIQIAFLILSAQ